MEKKNVISTSFFPGNCFMRFTATKNSAIQTWRWLLSVSSLGKLTSTTTCRRTWTTSTTRRMGTRQRMGMAPKMVRLTWNDICTPLHRLFDCSFQTWSRISGAEKMEEDKPKEAEQPINTRAWAEKVNYDPVLILTKVRRISLHLDCVPPFWQPISFANRAFTPISKSLPSIFVFCALHFIVENHFSVFWILYILFSSS